MRGLFVVPPTDYTSYESQASPTFALIALLPLVNLATRFPGLAPWVYEVPRQLTVRKRSDYALVTAFLYGLMPRLAYGDEEMASVEVMLDFLRQVNPDELTERTILGLMGDGGEEQSPPTDRSSLRALVATIPSPTPGESVEIDVERAVAILQAPLELRAFLVDHLKELWYAHLEQQWERTLPTVRRQVAAARTQFGAVTPAGLFRAVTGRAVPDTLPLDFAGVARVLFCPLPFFGPYIAILRRPGIGDLRIGYGVGAQPRTESGAAGGNLPGGLLPALEALSDETRLEILAFLRDRGTGRAQDFMEQMGLSQPATSRHMRLLESTGLVLVERRDGVKWYQVNGERLALVAASLTSLVPGESPEVQ